MLLHKLLVMHESLENHNYIPTKKNAFLGIDEKNKLARFYFREEICLIS